MYARGQPGRSPAVTYWPSSVPCCTELAAMAFGFPSRGLAVKLRGRRREPEAYISMCRPPWTHVTNGAGAAFDLGRYYESAGPHLLMSVIEGRLKSVCL